MGKCFICHRYLPTEVHHIFGASNRKNSTRYKLCVDLCAECHRTGKNAVHKNAETMQWLHEYGQKKAMRENGWTIEDFRKVFHANYLEGEEDDQF